MRGIATLVEGHSQILAAAVNTRVTAGTVRLVEVDMNTCYLTAIYLYDPGRSC
jgi:hypothetical protein